MEAECAIEKLVMTEADEKVAVERIMRLSSVKRSASEKFSASPIPAVTPLIKDGSLDNSLTS